MDTLKASTVPRNGSLGGKCYRALPWSSTIREIKFICTEFIVKNEFQNNLSGTLRLKAKGSRLKAFEIIEVRTKSVAERPTAYKGDLLVNLNGNAIETFNLNEINAIFNSKPGRKVFDYWSRRWENQKNHNRTRFSRLAWFFSWIQSNSYENN